MSNNYSISEETLNEIIKYIEQSEETFDAEFGLGRDLKELIILNEMPNIYNKLLKLKHIKQK